MARLLRSCPITYWLRKSKISRGLGIALRAGRPFPARRCSSRIKLWHNSMQEEQIKTSLAPSTMGPASRWLFPQKLQTLERRPRLPEVVPRFPLMRDPQEPGDQITAGVDPARTDSFDASSITT